MRTTIAIAAALLLLVGPIVATAEDHPAPENVDATCGSTSATVTWSPVNDPDLAGYDVYRRRAGDPSFTKVNGALVTGTQFVDTGLSTGVTYDFGVKSIFNDDHESPLSEIASCTTS